MTRMAPVAPRISDYLMYISFFLQHMQDFEPALLLILSKIIHVLATDGDINEIVTAE